MAMTMTMMMTMTWGRGDVHYGMGVGDVAGARALHVRSSMRHPKLKVQSDGTISFPINIDLWEYCIAGVWFPPPATTCFLC